MFVLLIINIVILIQVRSSRALWRKPLNDDQVKTVTNFTLYPLLVGLLSTAIVLLIPSNALATRSRVVDIVLSILAFVPVICIAVSTIGVLWVYYGSGSQVSGQQRSGSTMT